MNADVSAKGYEKSIEVYSYRNFYDVLLSAYAETAGQDGVIEDLLGMRNDTVVWIKKTS